jgi:hypothetical protein
MGPRAGLPVEPKLRPGVPSCQCPLATLRKLPVSTPVPVSRAGLPVEPKLRPGVPSCQCPLATLRKLPVSTPVPVWPPAGPQVVHTAAAAAAAAGSLQVALRVLGSL